jgi:Multicopper oxidase
MGSGSGRYTGQELNTTSPLARDTILIPAYSWMVLRFITDNREHSLPAPFNWNYVIYSTHIFVPVFPFLPKRAFGRSTATLRGIWRLDC